MAGTKEGAEKRLITQAVQAEISGEIPYAKWGSKGGKKSKGGGFSSMSKKQVQAASKKGLEKRWEKSK